jgi:hypothetical protein
LDIEVAGRLRQTALHSTGALPASAVVAGIGADPTGLPFDGLSAFAGRRGRLT